MTLDNNEITFLRLYKEGITHFNMLERNMAYYLWHAELRSTGQDRLEHISNYSFSEKLQRVKKLVSTEQRRVPYEPFLNQAEQCRLYRNKLVHGHWESRWHQEKPIHFHVAAPFEENGSMTLDDFAKYIEFIKEAAALFYRLSVDWGPAV